MKRFIMEVFRKSIVLRLKKIYGQGFGVIPQGTWVFPKNVVVAALPEGILISDKEQSSSIKPFVDSLNRQVMFADKSWGAYKVLDVGQDSLTIKVILPAGKRMNYHSHEKRNEVWIVIGGRGRTIVDGIEQFVKEGDVITLEAGRKHTVIAQTELQMIEVQLGKDICVSDKQKYGMPL